MVAPQAIPRNVPVQRGQDLRRRVHPLWGIIGFLCTSPPSIFYSLHKKCRIPVHRTVAMQDIGYELCRMEVRRTSENSPSTHSGE